MVDVFCLKVSPSLQDVERADSSTSLRSVVQGCFTPLISHFDLQARLPTQRRDCLDRVDLVLCAPVANLDEGVVEGHSPTIVRLVDVHTVVDQDLLSFECGVGSR